MFAAPAHAGTDYELVAQLTLYLIQGLGLDRVLAPEGPRQRARGEATAIAG